MDNMRAINNDIYSFITGVEQINTKATEIAETCDKQVIFYKVHMISLKFESTAIEFF